MDSICSYFVKDLYFYLNGRYCFLSHCLKLGAVMVAPPPNCEPCCPYLRSRPLAFAPHSAEVYLCFVPSAAYALCFVSLSQAVNLCLNLWDREVAWPCPGDLGSLLWRREVSKKVGVASCWRGLSGVTGRELYLLWTPVEVREKEGAHECEFSSGLGLPGILRCHVSP